MHDPYNMVAAQQSHMTTVDHPAALLIAYDSCHSSWHQDL